MLEIEEIIETKSFCMFGLRIQSSDLQLHRMCFIWLDN